MCSALASTNFTRHESFAETSVWTRSIPQNLAQHLAELLAPIRQDLPSIKSHWLFNAHLPSNWAILIDGEWTKTAGLYSTDLKSPDGAQAILLTPNALMDGTNASNLVVHELTHLFHFNLRPNEESWVREGVALLAEYVVTGRMTSAIEEAFAEPESSLTAPLDLRTKRISQYGHLFLYFYYIYKLCGRNELLNELVESKSEKAGAAFIDETLRKTQSAEPVCQGFRESFSAFQIARFKSEPTKKSGFVLATSMKPAVRDEPTELLPFAAQAYRLKPGKTCAQAETAWGTGRCIRVRFE